MSSPPSTFVSRLDAVMRRLEDHAHAGSAGSRLTAADPPTGERWDAGQVWAHVAEFIPYWVGEATRVLAGAKDILTPFGRTKSDPGRVAAIERDRTSDRLALWQRAAGDLAMLRAFLSGIPAAAWERRGVHPTLGPMTVTGLVDEFLVGHLEQHAAQLDEVSTDS